MNIIPQKITDSDTLGTLTKAEINQQISTAKQYPRSLQHFKNECMEMIGDSQETAQSCIYVLPRGGKRIEGASIRFAEMIVSGWGNCIVAARVIEEGLEFVTAQGVFHDLEKNTKTMKEIKRRITDKNGNRYNADMIAVTANAACSIAVRNAILGGIPKVFWQQAYQRAIATVKGDVKTLPIRRENALKTFEKMGITKDQICQTLDVGGVADIGIDELYTLTGILNAIDEGTITAERAFAMEETEHDDGTKSASEIAQNIEKKAQARKGKTPNKKQELEPAKKPVDEWIDEHSDEMADIPQ